MKDKYSREVRATISGEECRILINLKGLILAGEHGFDIEDLEVEGEEDLEELPTGKRLEVLARYMWVGMLPFEEDLAFDDLLMRVTLGDLPAMTEAFQKIKSRQLTDEVKEKMKEVAESTEGKD
jgi:hypothetical protein